MIRDYSRHFPGNIADLRREIIMGTFHGKFQTYDWDFFLALFSGYSENMIKIHSRNVLGNIPKS